MAEAHENLEHEIVQNSEEAPNADRKAQASQSQDFELYMGMAIELAREAAEAGEVPVGAVVVYEPVDKGTRKLLAAPKVIASARNSREADRDATAHAELEAMRQAMQHLGAWRLADCTVYVTLEPCVMCAGAMQQARVSRCVYGASDPKGGALGSLYHIGADERLNHTFEAVEGVRAEECASLLRDFFRKRRGK